MKTRKLNSGTAISFAHLLPEKERESGGRGVNEINANVGKTFHFPLHEQRFGVFFSVESQEFLLATADVVVAAAVMSEP